MPARSKIPYFIFKASSMSPAVSLVRLECLVSFKAFAVMSLISSSRVFLKRSTASRATIWAPTLFMRSLSYKQPKWLRCYRGPCERSFLCHCFVQLRVYRVFVGLFGKSMHNKNLYVICTSKLYLNLFMRRLVPQDLSINHRFFKKSRRWGKNTKKDFKGFFGLLKAILNPAKFGK